MVVLLEYIIDFGSVFGYNGDDADDIIYINWLNMV